MAIELRTTQGVKYAESQTPTRSLIAWEHGECAMRQIEIDRIPRVRITSGKHGSVDLAGHTGALSSLTFDLTGERYDRYYNAWVKLDKPIGSPTWPIDVVCVPVEGIEYVAA